jgi:hypothetical protein
VRFSLCFVGSEAVDWLTQKGAVSNRQEAKVLMQSMMDMNVVEHMTNKKKYEDSNSVFYRCRRAPRLCGNLVKEGHVSCSFSASRLQYFSMWAVVDERGGMRFFRAREHAKNSYPILYVPRESIRTDALNESTVQSVMKNDASAISVSLGNDEIADEEIVASNVEGETNKKKSLRLPKRSPRPSKSGGGSSSSFNASSSPSGGNRSPRGSAGNVNSNVEKSAPNSITKTFLDAGDSSLGYSGVVWEFKPVKKKIDFFFFFPFFFLFLRRWPCGNICYRNKRRKTLLLSTPVKGMPLLHTSFASW